ncbi:uncharacterized protein LOC111259453 [Varroa jacobsoni]|uniref:uncharacterized protein LOC111259453 n=1 Tax=Varroa jacobsoni TaxID=62625 RepID=UPI000BF40ADC|nr:uncharacterized protein LOC111259453 [Varroa jacobsoni]
MVMMATGIANVTVRTGDSFGGVLCMTLGKRSAPTSIRLYERRMACSDGDGDQRSRKATAVPCIMPKTAGVAHLAGGRYCTVLSGAAIVSITTIAYVFWHCSCAAAKLSSADDGECTTKWLELVIMSHIGYGKSHNCVVFSPFVV